MKKMECGCRAHLFVCLASPSRQERVARWDEKSIREDVGCSLNRRAVVCDFSKMLKIRSSESALGNCIK
jgi:hypothetical protein